MHMDRDPRPERPVGPVDEDDEGYAWNYYGREAVPEGGDPIRPPRRPRRPRRVTR